MRQRVFNLRRMAFWKMKTASSILPIPAKTMPQLLFDLNPKQGAYWRGVKKRGEEAKMLRDQYPQEIVEIFEKHGFIWGGKWSHFDLMHFEYRPELLQKWRLVQGTRGTSIISYYSNTPSLKKASSLSAYCLLALAFGWPS